MNINDFEIFKHNYYTPFINNNHDYLLNQSPYLDIILTDYCNANCLFCIASLIHDKLVLDLELAKPKIEFAIQHMGVREVLLLGGEPTVAKLLIPMIEWLCTLGLDKICMTTNGILLATNPTYASKILSAGLTHLNISFMSIHNKKQQDVCKHQYILTIADIARIAGSAHVMDIKVRINNNSFKNNNDKLYEIITFYESLKNYVDSIKISPLLKVDAFSVLDYKTQWVTDNILTDQEYDELFESIENYYCKQVSVITNNEQFGFVKNSMIPLPTPIILNWNQHGQMMQKVVNEHKINNLKLLPNGELSLSWNRELIDYYIKIN